MCEIQEISANALYVLEMEPWFGIPGDNTTTCSLRTCSALTSSTPEQRGRWSEWSLSMAESHWIADWVHFYSTCQWFQLGSRRDRGVVRAWMKQRRRVGAYWTSTTGLACRNLLRLYFSDMLSAWARREGPGCCVNSVTQIEAMRGRWGLQGSERILS